MGQRAPLGNVLVATDLSAGATRALERASRLPLGSGSTLTVLHVLSPEYEPEDRAEAERALDRNASLAAGRVAESGASSVRVVPRIVEGKPFVEIIRAAREGQNELVVVGRHGRRTFRDLLLGSTAERVIRKGRTSVLIVTAPASAPYGHPLVALDFSDRSRHALELAWRLADAVSLDVVHAYEVVSRRAIERAGFSPEDGLQYELHTQRYVHDVMQRFLAASHAVAATPIAREGDPRSVILDVAAERHADLLALDTHGRSTAAHVLIGSVAEAVIRHARCDVLVASAAGPTFELP